MTETSSKAMFGGAGPGAGPVAEERPRSASRSNQPWFALTMKTVERAMATIWIQIRDLERHGTNVRLARGRVSRLYAAARSAEARAVGPEGAFPRTEARTE